MIKESNHSREDHWQKWSHYLSCWRSCPLHQTRGNARVHHESGHVRHGCVRDFHDPHGCALRGRARGESPGGRGPSSWPWTRRGSGRDWRHRYPPGWRGGRQLRQAGKTERTLGVSFIRLLERTSEYRVEDESVCKRSLNCNVQACPLDGAIYPIKRSFFPRFLVCSKSHTVAYSNMWKER